MEKGAKLSKERKEDFVSLKFDDNEEEDEDFEDQAQYIYMELKSTTSFKDIDIDAMLEHTTFDEFMKGLYTSRVAQTKTTKQTEKP